MSIIFLIFNEVLYRPFFNALVFLYNYMPGHDLGLAIIILTLLIKAILYPLDIRGIRSQRKMAEIQPQVKEIQDKYKDNKEKQTKEILDLYRKANINPFSSILVLLIQLPVLIALYQVFWRGINASQANLLYGFVSMPSSINPLFLGIFNMVQPNLILSILAGAFQFWQTKLLSPKTQPSKKQADFQNILQKEMQYVFPVFTVLVIMRLPSALSLYILTTGLFSVIQQYFIIKRAKK